MVNTPSQIMLMKAKSPVIGIHLPDGTVFPVNTYRLQKVLAGLTICSVSLVKIEEDRLTARKVILPAGTEVLEIAAGNGKFRFVRVKDHISVILSWTQKQRNRKPVSLPKGELSRLKLALADTEGWVNYNFYNRKTETIIERKGTPVYLGLLTDWQFLVDEKEGAFCIVEALSGISIGKGRNLQTLLKETIYRIQNLSPEKLAEIPLKIAAELELKFERMSKCQ
jgi:hypothetical protein